MNQLPELPELQIVPTDSLHPHEEIEPGRARGLIRSLQTEGFLKNPPVVLQIPEVPERYVVLDGANRTTAFKQMGFPHILVQIARSGVEVMSWNHVLRGESPAPLLEAIRGLEAARLTPTDSQRAPAALQARQSLMYLVVPGGEVWQLESPQQQLRERVDLLGKVVKLSEHNYRRERTGAEDLDGLVKLYPDLSCLLVYPRFEVKDVIEVAAKGGLFPSGTTRFLISPRALRVNFPLATLADRSPLESKRLVLEEWIRERMEHRRVRYYAESTFLFDE
ncbi:MAG TPA: ParB N-terminal domain-containing protein [Anaerolineales bacterium]